MWTLSLRRIYWLCVVCGRSVGMIDLCTQSRWSSDSPTRLSTASFDWQEVNASLKLNSIIFGFLELNSVLVLEHTSCLKTLFSAFPPLITAVTCLCLQLMGSFLPLKLHNQVKYEYTDRHSDLFCVFFSGKYWRWREQQLIELNTYRTSTSK